MTERDCIRFTVMVPNDFDRDYDIHKELQEILFDECGQIVIREFGCKLIVKEGEITGYKEWKFTVPLYSAEVVFHRIALWAEEWLHHEKSAGRMGVDSIMLEKEFVKKVYLR